MEGLRPEAQLGSRLDCRYTMPYGGKSGRISPRSRADIQYSGWRGRNQMNDLSVDFGKRNLLVLRYERFCLIGISLCATWPAHSRS